MPLRFVRNKKRPQWGIGVVREITSKYTKVLFLKAGRRTLANSADVLHDVADHEVPAYSPLRDQAQWPKLERPAVLGRKKRKRQKIILISRRGKRIEKATRCNNCHKTKYLLWQYKESSHGQVVLCGICKDIVRDRSFEKIDILQFSISGGAFETNRRRH